MTIASPLLSEYLRQLSVPDDWDPGIAFAELSDVGMRRSNNQDSSACLPASSRERFQTHGHLFVVADGMGAHAAGELASQIATERIAMHYFRSSQAKSSEALRGAVTEANMAAKNEFNFGFNTLLSLATLNLGLATTINIGVVDMNARAVALENDPINIKKTEVEIDAWGAIIKKNGVELSEGFTIYV